MNRQFTDQEKEAVANRAKDLSKQGMSCSESVLQAVGEVVLDELPEALRKAATPFSGGVMKGTELCGALTGGLMVIGAIYGRTEPTQSRDFCRAITASHVTAFSEQYECTRCNGLKDQMGWNTPEKSCSDLIGGAARMVLDTLSRAAIIHL